MDQQARVRRRTGSEFHIAFAEAVARKGVTLDWLRRRLADSGNPVSLATLSYWRSGRSQPERQNSLDALAQIETLLGLDRDALSQHLGPSRRTGPLPTLAPVHDVVASQAELVQQALVELDQAGVDEFAIQSIQIDVDVDVNGRPQDVTVRCLWRATVDDAQRSALIYAIGSPIGTPPELSITGGRFGRDVSRPERGLVAREIVLDRPLQIGEETILEQHTRWIDDVDECGYEHYVLRPVRELAVWVRFHPERVPTSALSFTVLDGVRAEQALNLDGVTAVHLALRQFGPGRAGIEWTW